MALKTIEMIREIRDAIRAETKGLSAREIRERPQTES